jgi:hypothetical protein
MIQNNPTNNPANNPANNAQRFPLFSLPKSSMNAPLSSERLTARTASVQAKTTANVSGMSENARMLDGLKKDIQSIKQAVCESADQKKENADNSRNQFQQLKTALTIIKNSLEESQSPKAQARASEQQPISPALTKALEALKGILQQTSLRLAKNTEKPFGSAINSQSSTNQNVRNFLEQLQQLFDSVSKFIDGLSGKSTSNKKAQGNSNPADALSKILDSIKQIIDKGQLDQAAQTQAAGAEGAQPKSGLDTYLKNNAGFKSHPAGFNAVAIKDNGEVDVKKTVNKLVDTGVISKDDKDHVSDLLEGKGHAEDIPQTERAKMFNKCMDTVNFRQTGPEFLIEHKGMQTTEGYDAIVKNKEGKIDVPATVDRLHEAKIIDKGDKNDVAQLLRGEKSAKHLSEPERKELYNRIIRHDNDIPGKGVDASRVIGEADKLAEQGEPMKLDNYLQQIGARASDPLNANASNTKLGGVDSTADLSIFADYKITGKDKNGKKVEIKVNRDEALNGPYQRGKLRGIDAAVAKAGIADISELKDVKIDGRLDNDKPYKLDQKQLNKVAKGEAHLGDFRKKGFFEKIGNAITDGAKGFANFVSAGARGLVAGVKNISEGMNNGKGFFDALGDGFATGTKKTAAILKEGLSQITKGAVGWTGAVTGAVFGEAVGNAASKTSGFIFNVGSGMITSASDGSASIAEGTNNLTDGRGSVESNLGKITKGGLDVASTFSGVGTAAKAGQSAIQVVKAGDKGVDAARASGSAREGAEAFAKKIDNSTKKNTDALARKNSDAPDKKSWNPIESTKAGDDLNKLKQNPLFSVTKDGASTINGVNKWEAEGAANNAEQPVENKPTNSFSYV